MRNQALSLTITLGVFFFGCQKEEETPPPQYPQQQPYGQQPYGQQPYGQQPPAAQPTVAPTAAPTVAPPAATTAAPAGTLSAPGPFAIACTTDANCVTFKCNTQFGKCASPCQTDNDCIPGNKCQMPGPTGICIPAPQ